MTGSCTVLVNAEWEVLFQHFRHFCINANVLHFASQPASFNQVHQTSVQPARTQGNPITKGEYDNQPNIWLHTNPTQTVHTHTHTWQELTCIQYTHTLVGTQESLYILKTRAPTHTHARTWSVHFVAQSNHTFINSLSWLYAVGELGFNSRS